MNRLLLETDAPYFRPKRLSAIHKPCGHRSGHYYTGWGEGGCYDSYSVPGHVWFVANQVAFFKNITVKKVLQANRDAVKEVYKIPFSNKSDFKSSYVVTNYLGEESSDENEKVI